MTSAKYIRGSRRDIVPGPGNNDVEAVGVLYLRAFGDQLLDDVGNLVESFTPEHSDMRGCDPRIDLDGLRERSLERCLVGGTPTLMLT